MNIVHMVGQKSWVLWVLLLQAVHSVLGEAQVAGETISRRSKEAQEFRMGPNVDRSNTNGVALAPEAKLSLEDLRALLHVYSRLNRSKMVEGVAGRILSRNARDKETLRLLASYYLEKKDAARALKHARALVKFYPDDAEAHFLLAMACKLDGQYRRAKEVLAKLKSEGLPNRFFPYEAELASAAWLSGDWPQAIRSYQEALENPALQPEERREARNQLDQLCQIHLPQLLVKETSTHYQSGLVFRSLLEWSQPLAANHRLHLDLERDDLKLRGSELLRSQWANRYDAVAGLASDYAPWRTKVFVGIGDEGAIYGADLTRVLRPDEDLTLAVHGNQRATDSLLLETLHGREDELSLFWHTRFYPDVLANLKLAGRQVLLPGETLGYGYNVDLNLERIVLQNVPELHLGYRGLITGYSQSSENTRLVGGVAAPGTSDTDRLLLLNQLVGPIHLHGFYLAWQQTINPEWSWHALAGTVYSFTRSSFGHTFEAGASYSPTRRIALSFSAGYSTTASTSEQDTERWELSLALNYRF